MTAPHTLITNPQGGTLITTNKPGSVAINSNVLASHMRELAFDLMTRINYDLPDGVHAKTYVAMVMHLGELVAQIGDYDDDAATEAFYEASGVYEVAKHPSLEGFPYVLERPSERAEQ